MAHRDFPPPALWLQIGKSRDRRSDSRFLDFMPKATSAQSPAREHLSQTFCRRHFWLPATRKPTSPSGIRFASRTARKQFQIDASEISLIWEQRPQEQVCRLSLAFLQSTNFRSLYGNA